MKNLILITLLLLVLNSSSIAQTQAEQKILITDLIKNYPHPDYRAFSLYANGLMESDAKRFFDINGQDLSRILVVEYCNNTIKNCVTDFFDLKGIESIALVKEGDYLIIRINMLSGYLSVQEFVFIDTKLKENRTVLLNFSYDNKEYAEKLKKALLSVSRSFGGEPRDI